MIIDGKKIAEEMLAEVVEEVKKLPKKPRLAAILIGPSTGSGQASRKFLELKKKMADRVGIDFRMYEWSADITTQKLRKEIVGIAKAQVNQGILIELPLPPGINTQYVLNAIPPEKDVDVLSEKSQGAFFAGRSVILPPVVAVVKIILEKNNIDIRGKNCAIFGYGLLVGKPISHWLAQNEATVSVINEHTLSAQHHSLEADIIISGVGKPNLVKADMVKEGAIVIDFGFNQKLENVIVGDVDFDEVSKKAGWITPVPGGVGPIVIAAVLKNLVKLISLNQKPSFRGLIR